MKKFIALFMAFLMVMSFGVSGFAAETAEEKESNDDAKTATAFGFGTTIKGALEVADDKDYFSFTSDAAGLASVSLAHNEIVDASKNLAFFAITVYDAGLKEIVSFNSTGADKTVASPSFAIDAETTYYVMVEMGTVHNENLEYSITASFDKGAYTEKEPNNQAATATNLELSTSGNAKHYFGTIASTGKDVDFYRIAPSKQGVIYIYLYNGATPSDFKATLYTHDEFEDGQLREVPITAIEINSNEDSKMSVGIGVAKKEYMLKIEGTNNKTGGYRTRVFFEPKTVTECEYNNEGGDANVIALEKNIQANISYAPDVDFFKFKAGDNNIGYKISIASLNKDSKNAGSWLVTVRDGSTQAPLKGSEKVEVKAGTSVFIPTEKLVAGRWYYIEVTKGGTLNTEVYEIKVNAIVPVKDDDKDDSNEVSFGDQIAIYWGQFWKNFEGWFEQIDVMSIVKDIASSVVTVFTLLFSMA